MEIERIIILSAGKENIRTNRHFTFNELEKNILLLFGNGLGRNFGKLKNLSKIRFLKNL